MNRKQLARELREIEAIWEVDPTANLFYNGICWALKLLRMVAEPTRETWSHAYTDTHTLLFELQDKFSWRLQDDCKNWSSRATMCLLMAEWLETEEAPV